MIQIQSSVVNDDDDGDGDDFVVVLVVVVVALVLVMVLYCTVHTLIVYKFVLLFSLRSVVAFVTQ